jgi:hypothetical protein
MAVKEVLQSLAQCNHYCLPSRLDGGIMIQVLGRLRIHSSRHSHSHIHRTQTKGSVSGGKKIPLGKKKPPGSLPRGSLVATW